MNAQEYIDQFGSLSTWDAYRAGVESAAQVVDQQVEVYPESVFIPPPAGQHGKTVDACSAAALRAVLPVVARKIRQLADPETKLHCAICSWPVGQHAPDCPLYSWPCGLCGALVSKRTEGDHARSHAALPLSTSNACLCGNWPKQSTWLHCPWCGCTLSAAQQAVCPECGFAHAPGGNTCCSR